MGDHHNKTKERIPMDLAPTPLLKVEPPRNSPGPALLRTVPIASQQTRFLATNIQASTSTSGTTLNKPGHVQRIDTHASGMGPTAVINRLALPGQTSTTSSYHVPRGPAAVANIAVPRSSLATPIMRGAFSVSTSASQSGFMSSRGSTTPWLGVSTTQAPRQSLNPQGRLQVNSRLGSTSGTTVSTRPVLLPASTAHKQLTVGQSQVHLTEKKIIQKGAVLAGSRGPVPIQGPGRVSRLAPPLRPVVLPTATAVLVSAPAALPQPAPLAGPNTLQLQTTTVVPSSIAINTRPVSVLTSAVRMATAPNTGVAVSKVYCPAPEPVYIQTTHKPSHGANMVSIANSLYSLPANTFYDTFTTAPVTTTSVQQARQTTSQVQGIVTAGQPLRFTSPVMVVDQSVHPYMPESSQTLQSTETCNSTTVSSPALSVKQNASPRPSILRKRDTEGTPGKAAKNLNPLFSTLSVATPSSPPSPPLRGNGGAQSSGGSTTISATSSPGLGTDSPPLKPDIIEEDRPVEMSPRKKPRKQQLTGNQMQEPKYSDEEMEFIPSEKVKKISKEAGTSHEGSAKSAAKRPAMSLMRNYRPTWKAKHLHFLRYSDVKPKEEKRPTVADIAAQKNVMQRVNGWKVYHLGAQMTDISNFEMDAYEKLSAMLKVLEKKSGKDGDINRVNELIKGNIQRSKVITDQIQEAKCQVMKLFDHKCQVTEVLNRFSSRRSGKKRERV